jgi:hypothetical protein
MKKEEKYLTEGRQKEFPPNIITKIRQLTKVNDHGGARVLAAKNMKNKRFLNAYEGLDKVYGYFGYLPRGLSDVRYEIDQAFFEYIKNTFSNGQDLYMSF